MTEDIRKAIDRLSAIDRKHADQAIESARALGALGAEALCAVLEVPTALNVPGGRRSISAELARQEPAGVIPALLKALAHEDWRPNQVASDAIGLMGEAAVPYLIENLETESAPNGRINTMLVLRRMGATAAAGAFAKLAREDDVAEGRAAAVEALGWLGGKESGSAVAAALEDASPLVRLKAVKAAGWLKAREAVEGTLAFARSTDAEGRAAAVYTLDRIADTRATPFVTDALKDPAPYVRWSAAVALRRLWQESCQEAIRAALADEEEPVRAAARETLRIAAPDLARKLLPEE